MSTVSDPPLGLHISTDHGFPAAVDSARELGAEAVQIFTCNPSSWRSPMADPRAARAFTDALREAGVRQVVSHANYLINLAGSEEPLYHKSCVALAEDLARGAAYGLDHCIVHIGSHKGAGLSSGYQQVVAAVEGALGEVPAAGCPRLLLENSAGTGNNVGGTFEDLATLMERLGEHADRVGICFDTCHAHASGYGMSGSEMAGATLEELDSVLGLDRVFVIHANDTQVPAGGKADRHWHIGEGLLGDDAFALLIHDPRTRALPFILETPGDEQVEGRRNLERLRALR
ncbi:MAG: deoxyribonuclease IV [Candidatus Dormibacteria bacterium]